LVIGDPGDLHVAAVIDRLPARGLAVLDAAALPDVFRHMDTAETMLVDRAGELVVLTSCSPARGWVRRFAPAGWDSGVRLGSHRAALLASRLGLLGAILRDPAVCWLTPIDMLIAAENKIVQYRAAELLGLRVPRTAVGGDPSELAEVLGDRFVVKPLGPGNFENEKGQQRVVFASVVTGGDLVGIDLLDAPFLSQQRLSAKEHLRVVTVQEDAWTAVLDAEGMPLDWRRNGNAHQSFTVSGPHRRVADDALSLAASLGVGYSSQDWLVDDEGPCFLDMNPGGQWLFLPHEVADAATKAIAAWLGEGKA
jgi:hypothetical protein